MKPKMPKDPELERQKKAAAAEKVNAIQDRLGTESDNAVRYFGRSGLSTPSLTGNVGTGSKSVSETVRDAFSALKSSNRMR